MLTVLIKGSILCLWRCSDSESSLLDFVIFANCCFRVRVHTGIWPVSKEVTVGCLWSPRWLCHRSHGYSDGTVWKICEAFLGCETPTEKLSMWKGGCLGNLCLNKMWRVSVFISSDKCKLLLLKGKKKKKWRRQQYPTRRLTFRLHR